MGLSSRSTPPTDPTRGVVVVAPGAAGLDAAAIAADLLRSAPSPPTRGAAASSATSRIGARRPAADQRAIDGVDRSSSRTTSRACVAGEGQPRAADAAQQALAITARTFALANLQPPSPRRLRPVRHHALPGDAAGDRRSRAARPRRPPGRVLVHQGQPATVFYSALVRRAARSWPPKSGRAPSTTRPTRTTTTPAATSRGGRARFASSELERALRAAGLRGDRLRDLRVLQRNASGRVSRLARRRASRPARSPATTSAWPSAASPDGSASRARRSSARRSVGGYRFTGRGFGHGVGLCVIGAGQSRGARRERRRDPAVLLSRRCASSRTSPRRRPPTRGCRPRRRRQRVARTADVLIALPASEESERARVVQLDPRARDEIATAARASRRRGDPRHGASDRRERSRARRDSRGGCRARPMAPTIDLLPLTILRQRGQLDRTIRHEVAHVLIDGAAEAAGRSGCAKAPRSTSPIRRPQPIGRHARTLSDETTSSCGRCRPARIAPPTRARKRASGARSSQGKRWSDVR